jgi:hypothetical protein
VVLGPVVEPAVEVEEQSQALGQWELVGVKLAKGWQLSQQGEVGLEEFGLKKEEET